jgi:hypothetical protein
MKLTVALVMVEWAAGMLAGLAFVHRLHPIGPGFTWLVGGVTAGITALGAVAGRHETSAWARARLVCAVLLGIIALAEVVAARTRRFWLDELGGGAALATCIAAAQAAGGGWLSVSRTLTGAAFLGAVSVGMTVGHWYLVDPSLPRDVIRGITQVFLVTVVLETVALLIPPGMVGQVRGSHRVGFSAVLPGFWIALLVLTGVLGLAVLGSLREKSYAAVMAATGLFDLAIITAFGVEILARALMSGSV